MSSDNDPRNRAPQTPRIDSRVQTEGFASEGHGRDIFFAAVQATRMPMVVADPRQPDVPLVFANHAFLEMTGYYIDEVLGRNCRFLQGPETDRSTVALIAEAVQSERELTVELLNYRKDGSTFWNALFLTPVRDEEGKLLYYFSSQLDVSRRRDAEAAMRQAQKMEALGQLTGGIAHDFNNLLQVITGNAEVAAARARYLAPDDVMLTRAVANVKDAAARSGALTQQLLAFARKQHLQGRVVNVNEVIARTAAMAASSLGDVRVVMELDPALSNARVDPSQFETAVLNLLVNARDAMPDGGRIWVRSSNKQSPDVRLLLTDIIMPGNKNGVLLAHEAQRIAPALRILLMTGFADGSPERWGGESYEVVLKPFTSEELRRRVRQVLDGQT